MAIHRKMTAFDEQRIEKARLAALFQKYDLICNTVSARDVANVLGLDMDSHGRCRCPFHNGDDRNMIVYEDAGRGYYCFVCHAYGNCIKLAQKLLSNDCRYHEAAQWIDRTFHLKVFEDRKPSFQERIRRAQLYAQTHGGNKT